MTALGVFLVAKLCIFTNENEKEIERFKPIQRQF